MKIEPIELESDFVMLLPLEFAHFEALCEVGLNENIWRWSPEKIKNADDMRRYIERALNEVEKKIALPFVTIDKSQNKIVGSTRFGNIDVKNRKAEIGWTWINPSWQRSNINTEAKLLMLTHAFEIWGCIRVELKTDLLNKKSRNAILRLGAKQEGILRRHIITDNGRFRDTVYFSIINDEWLDVKKNLHAKLKNYQ